MPFSSLFNRKSGDRAQQYMQMQEANARMQAERDRAQQQEAADLQATQAAQLARDERVQSLQASVKSQRLADQQTAKTAGSWLASPPGNNGGLIAMANPALQTPATTPFDLGRPKVVVNGQYL